MNNIKTKKCTKCSIVKCLSEFYKDKRSKHEYLSKCKQCCKEYVDQNKQKIQKRAKKWYDNNREKALKTRKNYRNKNREKIAKNKKIWYIKNKKKIIKQKKEYYTKNKKIIKKRTKEYTKNKLKTDINFKILYNLRRRINHVLKNHNKSLTSMILIGCEIDYLMYHIQKQFTKSMNWDNYGLNGWEIDHKLPCAKFDLSKKSEQLKCFNYTNLQPLWAIDNKRKSDKIL